MVWTGVCALTDCAVGELVIEGSVFAVAAPVDEAAAGSWAHSAGANTKSTKMAATTRMDTLILSEMVDSCPTRDEESAGSSMLNCGHRTQEWG